MTLLVRGSQGNTKLPQLGSVTHSESLIGDREHAFSRLPGIEECRASVTA
jgi:hypothetical protein